MARNSTVLIFFCILFTSNNCFQIDRLNTRHARHFDARPLQKYSRLLSSSQNMDNISVFTQKSSLTSFPKSESPAYKKFFRPLAIYFYRTLPLLALLLLGISPSIAFAATTAARTAQVVNPSGWDIYGRVPYDDWLFTSERLIEPNLLRRTLQEAISAELPIALANFRRNKTVSDVLGLVKGCAYMMVGMYVMGFLIKRARQEISKDREREARVRGFSMPIAATYKGVDRPAGREVDGMEGWVDMSRDGNRQDRDEEEEDEEDDEEEESGKDGEDDKSQDKKGNGKKGKGK